MKKYIINLLPVLFFLLSSSECSMSDNFFIARTTAIARRRSLGLNLINRKKYFYTLGIEFSTGENSIFHVMQSFSIDMIERFGKALPSPSKGIYFKRNSFEILNYLYFPVSSRSIDYVLGAGDSCIISMSFGSLIGLYGNIIRFYIGDKKTDSEAKFNNLFFDAFGTIGVSQILEMNCGDWIFFKVNNILAFQGNICKPQMSHLFENKEIYINKMACLLRINNSVIFLISNNISFSMCLQFNYTNMPYVSGNNEHIYSNGTEHLIYFDILRDHVDFNGFDMGVGATISAYGY
ncbi:MAG: hypothetical protein KAH32_06265 [Chlamydiia bacterium]|nr:hypothetical protein [Chlamydiia bacterium]